MRPHSELSRHAGQRSCEGAIPHMIAELIVDYGARLGAGDNAQKYVLTRASIR